MTRPAMLLSGICLLMIARGVLGQTYVFSLPTDDRWQYPFNFSPGTRTTGSCFGAGGMPGFNDRDGIVIIAWNTTTLIPAGLGSANYPVDSVRVTLTNQPGAVWPIDLTPDEWYTFDLNQDGVVNGDGVPRGQLGDTDGESSDADPGRAIELFGTGFGPSYTATTWNEFSFYEGSDSTIDLPRDPFPFMFRDGTLDLLHVENNVKGQFNSGLTPPFCGPPDTVCPFTPRPWAVGVPVAYIPGAQTVPFQLRFDIDLTLSGGAVRAWYQQRLNEGRVFATITSLAEATMFGDPSGFPSFYMKESTDPGAAPGSLTIVLCHRADIDCNGVLDGTDVALFVSVLLDSDHNADHVRRSDLNEDGVTNGRDIAPYVQAFLSPP